MVQANLDKPGRRYVVDEGEAFRVYGHASGNLEIERTADGWTAFFQGDDAFSLESELLLTHEKWTVDDVCDEYSTILTSPED